MSSRVRAVLLVGVLSACTGRFTVPPEPSETEGVRPRCGEVGTALEVDPITATVGATQLLVLTASGGTGAYRWSIAENASGATVDPNAGVYVAGLRDPDLPATTDVVRVEDLGCRGEALSTVTVVDAPRIAPTRVGVQRGESLTFVGSGGSGTYLFEVTTDMTGATIDATGRYTAGSRDGRDVVRLTDAELGSTADAVVNVSADASLHLAPTSWVVPVGSTLELPVSGGSEEYDLSVSGGAVEVLEGTTTIRAVSAGSATITLDDRFVPRSLTVNVTAVAPHEASRRHPGDRSERHLVGPSGDFDGDGFIDVVVGMPDYASDWWEGGAVLIFRGTAGGLDPAPARVIRGSSRDEEMGSALEVADVDADGIDDLLVGARRYHGLRSNGGAVFVYSGTGVAGELFSPEPTITFLGANSYDLFGSRVAACDFNADGLTDVAIAAPYAQFSAPDGESDQGVISVYLAYSGGRFVSSPDDTVLGWIYTDSDPAMMGRSWIPDSGYRLGEAMAVGDYDGDGACDIAAYGRMAEDSLDDSGVVALYRGVAASDATRGGVEELPSLFWGHTGSDDNARFGQFLAMGDINGDGLADIVAGRHLHDGVDGTDTGAVYARFGRALDGPATGITEIEAGADWSVEGLGSERVGNTVQVADVNGDGVLDVVSGDSRASVEDSELSRPGMIRYYLGQGGGPAATPSREFEGPQNESRFGMGMGAVGDLDGDGWSEAVAFASYWDEVDTDDRGALFLQASGGAVTELTVERTPSGQRVGQSVAWIGDLDGDGSPELAVGSSQTDVTGTGRNLGRVRIYRGTATGVDAVPVQELTGFTGHSDSDEVGYQVAGIGDFDGDSVPDLAVIARSEDLPDMLDAAVYDVGTGCTRRDNSGAVLIFRGLAAGRVESEPAFVYFGAESGDRVDAVIGADVDADGRRDLVVGGRDWDDTGSNRGGFEIVLGRASSPGRVIAICAGDTLRYGAADGDRLGSALARLGDIDGDTCEDFAVGVPEADPVEPDPDGLRNSGEVHVFFGFGLACADPTMRRARLYGADADSQGGLSLGGGADLDGDGVGDLVIGEPRFRGGGAGEVGRVVLVSGAYAASLVGASGPFINPVSSANLAVSGDAQGERLGESVSVARMGSQGVAILGAPFAASSGINDTGGADAWPIGADGFGADPSLRMSGETTGQGELGATVDAIVVSGRVYVAVGAPWSSVVSGDDGASYAFVMN